MTPCSLCVSNEYRIVGLRTKGTVVFCPSVVDSSNRVFFGGCVGDFRLEEFAEGR